MPTSLRAGAATSNITPPLGISLNGGMSDRQAAHIHDELQARCLVLDDGTERIGIVVCDSCMIPREVVDAAKEAAQGGTDLPLDRILISATHSHSCPTVAGVFQSDPDEPYIEFLIGRIADGLRRAVNNLHPAEVAWGSGTEPKEVFNRRWKLRAGAVPANPFGLVDQVKMNPTPGSADLVEPAGPTDPEISVLAVRRTSDGAPLAVLANYSLHYVGDVVPGHVSADYFGAFARKLSALLSTVEQDPPCIVMMSNGTSGNINNVNFKEPQARGEAYSRINAVADAVAREVRRVYQGLTFRSDVKLDMREAAVVGRVRRPSRDEIAKAKYLLAQGEGEPLKSQPEIYARETLLLADYPPEVEMVVQALRIGDLAIATTPCETFVETGLAVKAASPFKPTFVISLANGYSGYLPTREHHALGGYETWRARSSFLDVDAEEKIRSTMLKLLKELKT
jgi:neutral ceramidase